MKFNVFDTKDGYNNLLKQVSEDYFKIMQKRSSVLIYIDLYGSPKVLEAGAIVDIELVEKLIFAVKKISFPREIILATSGNILSGLESLKLQGFGDLKNIRLLDLDSTSKIRIQDKHFKAIRNVSLSENIILCDYFINISSLKRHVIERVAGCSMNMYNVFSNDLTRQKFMPICGKVIKDILHTTNPFLNVLDCGIILEGSGPVEGDPVILNKVVIGDNPILTDAVGCKLIGEDFRKSPHLKYLSKKKRFNLKVVKSGRRVKFISSFAFNLLRFHTFIKKTSLYLENLAYLFFLVSFVFISIGPKKIFKGRWMPFSEYFKIAWKILSRFEEPNNILNWKITINKHVEEESLS
ncbi:MAG: DUF362 domain-containing protein [Nanoarchaeota archaeon]|nr:DUF362 domain-containing protein [Nanoarchaeota archaeon]